ncbi:MAG: Wzz/FepE/Etk N-terminal domain-containing protein [Hyphomicrobiales bacterium]
MWQNTSNQQPRQSSGLDNSALQSNDVISDLKNTFAAVWHYKIWVIFTTILCLIAGIGFILVADPLYRGTNQIFIDPRSKSLVENEIVPTGLGRSSIGGDLILLDSQIEIIRSDTVLRKVLEQEKIDGLAPPAQSVGLVKSLSNFLKSFSKTNRRGLDPANAADAEELQEFRKSLWVTRLSNSYIVGINVRSNDPERAARLANMIAATYIEQQSSSRSSATRDTTISLNSRVETLREQVRKAEAAVESYRAENGLIGADGRLIDDDQLRDLNNRVVAAKAQTSLARARAESLKNSSVSDVLAGSSSEALASQVVSNIRQQLADLTRRESEALAQFGERHPTLAALRTERAGINTLLSQELQRIVKAAENNLAVAQTNEQFVQSQFDELTTASTANQKALVKLRELEREAASSRSVLESFLVRAKESDEQEELSNDSTRIISAASIPTIAFFPKKRLVLGASLFAGLSLGTLIAWLRALFSAPAKTSQTSDRRSATRPREDQANPQTAYNAESEEHYVAARARQKQTPQSPRRPAAPAKPNHHFKNDDHRQVSEPQQRQTKSDYDYAPPERMASQRTSMNHEASSANKSGHAIGNQPHAPRHEAESSPNSQTKQLFSRIKKHARLKQQQPPQPSTQLYSEPSPESVNYGGQSYQEPAPINQPPMNEPQHHRPAYAQPPQEPDNYAQPPYHAPVHEWQPQHNTQAETAAPYSKQTLDQKTSSLSEAIQALLPKTANSSRLRAHHQAPMHTNQQPAYPDHLVDPVNPVNDIVGHGGHVYGNNTDHNLSNLINKVEGNSRYPDTHMPRSNNHDTPPYPRSRARDLLRKLGR